MTVVECNTNAKLVCFLLLLLPLVSVGDNLSFLIYSSFNDSGDRNLRYNVYMDSVSHILICCIIVACILLYFEP